MRSPLVDEHPPTAVELALQHHRGPFIVLLNVVPLAASENTCARLGEFASFENVASEAKVFEDTRVPVQKFHSIEEMNEAPVPTDRCADFEQFLRHCARYWAMAPKVYPRGVFKFRSVEQSSGTTAVTGRQITPA